MISYVEDKNLFAQAIETRDYNIISNHINSNKEKWTKYISDNNSIYGYDIYKIHNLSTLYGFDVFAVNFFFDNVLEDFNPRDNEIIHELVTSFDEELHKQKGYYIIKISSANTMLINQINLLNERFIFTGNTICYLANKMNKDYAHLGLDTDHLTIHTASKEMKERFGEDIKNLSEKSFDNFFGQYHISHITRQKAPLIYRNWIDDYLEDNPARNILLAMKNEKVVGFLAYDETQYTNEIVLNAVDEDYRGQKIYERMLRKCVSMTLENNKLATISTQLNNYFPQRAWINSGFKPYHSFYLLHFNNLDSQSF